MGEENLARAKIIIDMRESQNYDELLSNFDIECARQQLSVGDFILSEKLVAERKSRPDFEASIIDGRLLEQASRLSGSYARAVLIVEGEGSEQRVDRRALFGAYCSLVSDFGISLFFTKNAKGTAELLSSMAKHEQLAKKTQLRVFSKKKCLSVEQFQLGLIESLPMVGPKMARKLLAHFGTPANILIADEKKLSEVDGFGLKKAKMLRNVLDSVYSSKDE